VSSILKFPDFFPDPLVFPDSLKFPDRRNPAIRRLHALFQAQANKDDTMLHDCRAGMTAEQSVT